MLFIVEQKFDPKYNSWSEPIFSPLERHWDGEMCPEKGNEFGEESGVPWGAAEGAGVV